MPPPTWKGGKTIGGSSERLPCPVRSADRSPAGAARRPAAAAAMTVPARRLRPRANTPPSPRQGSFARRELPAVSATLSLACPPCSPLAGARPRRGPVKALSSDSVLRISTAPTRPTRLLALPPVSLTSSHRQKVPKARGNDDRKKAIGIGGRRPDSRASRCLLARRGGLSSERRSRSPSPRPRRDRGLRSLPRVVSSQSRRCVLTGLHPAPCHGNRRPAAGETRNTTLDVRPPRPKPLREQQPVPVAERRGLARPGAMAPLTM